MIQPEGAGVRPRPHKPQPWGLLFYAAEHNQLEWMGGKYGAKHVVNLGTAPALSHGHW